MSYILRDVSFTEVGSVWSVGDGEVEHSETTSLLSYTLRYVSFVEVDRIYRVVLREPMHLCTCVSEEGGDGEPARSETASLLSYTLRYVSFTEVGSIFFYPLLLFIINR